MAMEKFHFTGADGKDYAIPFLAQLPAKTVRAFNRQFTELGRKMNSIEDSTQKGLVNMESAELMISLIEQGVGASSKEFKALENVSWAEQQRIVSDWFSRSGGESTPLAES